MTQYLFEGGGYQTMARIARIVMPGIPHHIVQRGNRRQKVFFNDKDRKQYLKLLHEEGIKAGIEFWGYCLMDNHVHLIAVPEAENSLTRGVGEAHRKYTRYVNFREGWRGYLWQGRFLSYPLDEKHLYTAVRYVERNPVRAGIVQKAEDYKWSSARAHVLGEKDKMLAENFLKDEIKDWGEFLSGDDNDRELSMFRKLSRTGRPMGEEDFIEKLENTIGRVVRRGKPGPKPKQGELSIVSPE